MGNYSAAQGALACAACPALTSTLANASVSAAQCLCVRGYYYLAGACAPCSPGSYKNATSNDPACILCPPNTYDTAVSAGDRTTPLVCRSVPPNAWSLAGSTGFACNAGYYYNVPLTLQPACSACPAGTYAPVSSTACTACANAMSLAASPSIANCTCNPGYYRANASTDCVPCPLPYSYCPGCSLPA